MARTGWTIKGLGAVGWYCGTIGAGGDLGQGGHGQIRGGETRTGADNELAAIHGTTGLGHAATTGGEIGGLIGAFHTLPPN